MRRFAMVLVALLMAGGSAVADRVDPAVTAMLLGPSGANQVTSRGYSITVRPPRQGCTTKGQISHNQRSNCR